MSFVQQIFASKSDNVFLVYAKDQDLDCYYYLSVFPEKIPLFKNLKQKKVDFLHYGRILYSGYGKPTPSVKSKMYKQYNFKEK